MRMVSNVITKEAIKMGVSTKPVKLTFSVKPDKIKEFKEINTSSKITEIQKKASEITNITIAISADEKK